jgi:hypothetical protein
MNEFPMAKNGREFFPCESCSNILTKVCFEDCAYTGTFKHYEQRPGTDIIELSPFPLDELLNEDNARERLLAIGVYLTAIVDYLQHMHEYELNRIRYKTKGVDTKDIKNGRANDSEEGSGILDRLPLSALLDDPEKADTPRPTIGTQDSDKGDGSSGVAGKEDGS